MKIKLLLATLLLSLPIFSQTNFEPGYIISDNGTKTQCLIKNEDWRANPTTFEYKLEENSEVKMGSIQNVTEFGSSNSFKFIKATVDIDQSTDVTNNLTDVRNPIMTNETLFLRVLAEGKASLYASERENIKRYFLKLENADIAQLVYKRYLISPSSIGTNEYYKQQLATALPCNDLNENSFENLQYKKGKLIRIITDYNRCKGSETIVYGNKEQSGLFNLTLRPGITFSSFSIKRQGEDGLDFEDKTGFRIGLEAEFVLPFNNGKWALFVEPTYRSYSSEATIVDNSLPTITKINVITIDYNSIELPLGGRYYMFLDSDSVFFLDAAVLFDVSNLNSKMESDLGGKYDLDVNADIAVALGVGYKFKNKYSVSARYHTPRQVLEYNNLSSAYNSFMLIAGYNFL
ncbi:outer membrane beta-barrel protein [Aequorivita sp. SDUM287046]|uniref:Outer membrane beta-barrel protein n=1 Tax=Aequorivita aurantiaca TaxID=3053356 RepID=A0ABT8DEZ1_9FLAO|nr:outer membrane beta-barrel protein [Aequorivita aurantiaca]MDN3723753.1 outer membrane beta-barrel protein [Aequorivita aurantiaca]